VTEAKLGSDGRTFSVGPDSVKALVEAADTNDAFSLVDYTAAPGVPGPPPHVHRETSETFYVLAGEVTFRAGDREQVLRAGEIAFVPPGIVHTFANAGSEPARWVGIFSPGHAMAMVEDIGKAFPEGGGPPDEAKMMAVVDDHDLEIVPEP